MKHTILETNPEASLDPTTITELYFGMSALA